MGDDDGASYTISAKRTNSRLNSALEKLSREYGLASQAMSLVTVVERKGDKAGKVPETRIVPVGMPQDVEMGSYFQSSIVCCSISPPRGKSAVVMESWDSSFISPDMKRKGKAKIPDQVTGMDLAVQLAGLIQADGGMPGRDEQERLASSLIAILTLIDLWGREGVGPLNAQIERLAEYVKKTNRSTLTSERQIIANDVWKLADSFLVMPGTTTPASCPWDESARKCVLLAQGTPDQGWAELEQRFQRHGSWMPTITTSN